MKRWEELTDQQKMNIRRWLTYLFDEGDEGFDAEWDAQVISSYQEYGCDLPRLLEDYPDPEDQIEARAIVHIWEQKGARHG